MCDFALILCCFCFNSNAELFLLSFNYGLVSLAQNAKGFTIDVLDYLGSQAQVPPLPHGSPAAAAAASQSRAGSSAPCCSSSPTNPSSPGNTSAERLVNVEMALEALRNVIRNNAESLISSFFSSLCLAFLLLFL